MKKIVLLLAVLSLLTSTLTAGLVDRNHAQSVAREFFAAKGIYMAEPIAMLTAPKRNTRPEYEPYYIFNAGDEQGFVIVSGDDRTAQVLGYSDKGRFELENIPDNLRSWLQFYADCISSLDESSADSSNEFRLVPMSPLRSSKHNAIEPLLTTKWHQNEPYSNLLPRYIYNNKEYACVTGCVATAVAQIMYKYQWPKATTAEIPEYNISENSGSYSIQYNMPPVPAGTPLEWNKMLPEYDDDHQEEEANAVATLMKLIGQSVNMDYGPSSGASVHDALNSLKNYFDYDSHAYIANRNQYDIDSWFNLILSELVKGKPVLYSGRTTVSGHAFILDGFDGDEYFHINWGWGGSYNGYFLIDVLNPDDCISDGTYSTTDGYCLDAYAIINLAPAGEADQIEPVSNCMKLTLDDIDGDIITFDAFCKLQGSHTFEIGIVMKDENGTIKFVNDPLVSNLSYNWGYYSLGFNVSNSLKLPGIYRLSPAARVKDSEIFTTLYDLESEWIEANVSDNGEIQLSMHISNPTLELTNYRFPEALVIGLVVNTTQYAEVTFRNTGDAEYFKTIYFFASNDEANKGDYKIKAQIALKPGEERSYRFRFVPDEVGKWYVWFCNDMEGTVIIGKTECIVIERPEPTVEVLDTHIYNDFSDRLESEVNHTLAITLRNNSYIYYSKSLYLFASNDENTIGSYKSSQYVYLNPEQEKEYKFKFTPTSAGTWYLWLCNDIEGTEIVYATQCNIVERLPLPSLSVENIVPTNKAIGDYLEGIITVKNTDTDLFDNKLSIGLWKLTNTSHATREDWTELPYEIPVGATIEIPFKFENLNAGESYFITLHYSRDVNTSANNWAFVNGGNLTFSHCWLLRKLGDINGDNSTDIGDLLQVVSILNGITSKPSDISTVDLNNDGDLTKEDEKLLRQLLLEE